VASRRARIAAFAGIGLLGTLAASASFAWWQRCALAEWLALRELALRGVPARLRVVRLDLHGAEIADVKLGSASAPDLSLAHAELAWSTAGLRAGRLDRIALRGLRLRARLDDAGLHLGALEALGGGEASDASGPLALPFLEARLADAEAVIDSPQGALRLRAEGSALPEGEIVRAELTLHGDSPQGALDFGGGGTLNLVSQEVAAAGALSGVTPWGNARGLVRVQGTLALMRAEFSGSAQPDQRTFPVRTVEPITLSGIATRDASGALDVSGEFAASGIAYEDLGALASVEGNATLRSDASGLAADVSFSAVGLQLSELGSAARVEGSVELRGERLGVQAALREIELPDLVRAASAKLSGSLELASGALSARLEAPEALAPELARLDGLVAEISLAGDELAGDVRVARLVELSQPALIAPLRVEAKLSGSPGRIAFAGKARTPGDGLVFELAGVLATASGQLELKIVLPETDLAPKTRQPDRVFPWLAGSVERARGLFGGEALASYVDGTLGASAVLALNGVDLATPDATLRGLMGVFSVTSIDPLETPPGQTLWMKSADAGLPLGAGSLRFQLKPDGILEIERGDWGYAGGKLILSGAIPLGADERKLELRVEGVSIEQLLAALDFEGLTGTGVLGGTTPLVWRGEQVLVTNGVLRATETGVIRFSSGEGGAALGRKQPVLLPVLGALENLQYDELTLTIDGDLGDRVAVKMHIRGRNPNFQKGRPVVLNVNVDLPLGSLLRAASVATGVPDEIEEQVQKAMGREKP
jgi:hypothetical protein